MNTGHLDEKAIFDIARQIESPGARMNYLEQVCGEDRALRERVAAMVLIGDEHRSFLESPPLTGVASTLDFAPVVECPGTQIGLYKLLEQIGEGGMGVVYHASQCEPVRRTVALKIIKPGMDSREVIKRFEAERQALAMMDHPNIAKVFDGGVTDTGRPYFAMELVRGKPITEYCDREQLTTHERLTLFVAVCQGVQHAHQKGIIHRDLKPSNILIKVYDVRPVPVVIDFGIAKATGQQLTEQSLHTAFDQMVGTPLYMSPEQAGQSCKDVDTRSDVYSLGVVLYELLTGSTPFERDTLRTAGVDEMRRIIREVEPPRPSARVSTLQAADLSTVCDRRHVEPHKLSQELRGELDWIVMKAMDKDRDRRYATVNDLAADVERCLHNEPVQACPPSIRYRLLKSVRRYKVAAVVTAVVTSTILASAAFSALKYVDERAARQDSDEQKLVAFRHAERAENQATEATRQRVEAVHQKTEAERQRDAARQNLYFADMRLAYVDIGQGNTSRAGDNLLFHFPEQGEADRRGWEWYYLLGRSHEADQSLYGHRGAVWYLAWSPDGNHIASASEDGSARVWDAKTGKQLRCFDRGPTIKCGIGWSPDSRKLAWGSCSDEAALRVWNRDTDEIAVVHGHQGSIWAVAWSHDGKYVATGSIHCEDSSGNVRIWDMEKLESIAQFTSAHHPESVSWSPNDRLLAVSSKADGHIIWDVASQQQLPDLVMELARCAAWHPTEQQLAVGDDLGNCLIWDHRSQKPIRQWKAHQGGVQDLKWSGDGTRLLSSGSDGMVKLWEAKEEGARKSVAHTGRAKSVDWDPTGRRFASAGTDGVIRIWPAENRPSPLVINTPLQGTLDLTWDNESSGLLLASGNAGKIGVWEARSGKKLEEIPLAQSSTRRLVSFRHVMQRSPSSGGGRAVVSFAGVPASVALANAVPPTALNTGQLCDDAVLSPDGTRIAYMSFVDQDPARPRPLIRNLQSERVVQCPEITVAAGAAWSPDGRFLAVVGGGEPSDGGTWMWAGWVHVFDADSGERLRKLQIGTSRELGSAVAWSHDGRKFATGNQEGLCEIWDAGAGRKLVSARIHSSQVNDLAWSLDDRCIASGGTNEQVHLWDSSTGQQLLALEPHGAPIRHIRWSPDGRQLAAVSDDGAIRVWDATKGYELPGRDFWRRLIEPSQWKEFNRLTDEQRWSEAADLLKKMIAAGSPDWSPMYLLALLNLQLDDQAAYRETCKRMVATFGDTGWDKQPTAWVCALRPDTLEDYSVVITLARQAVEGDVNSRTKRETGSASLPETMGAVLFRAGQYEEALRHLQAASEKDASQKQSPARIAFLTAMTHHRLGHATDAQMWIDRATKGADEELNNTANPHGWSVRLELSLLQGEARELIGVQTKAGQQPRADGVRKNKP